MHEPPGLSSTSALSLSLEALDSQVRVRDEIVPGGGEVENAAKLGDETALFSLFSRSTPGIPIAVGVVVGVVRTRSVDFWRGPVEGRSPRGDERESDLTSFLNGFSLRGLVMRGCLLSSEGDVRRDSE